MKKLIKTRLMPLMLSVIMLMLPFNVIAETSDNTEIRGDWIYRSGTNEIVAYNGTGGDIVIPSDSTVNASDIRIDSDGLYSQSLNDYAAVTGITISSGAEVDASFYVSQVRNLRSITYNNNYEQNGDIPLFGRNTNLAYIKLPDGMTAIKDSMFSGCTNLQTVILPDSLLTIGENAFNDCRALTSIDLPEGLTSIGSSAFGGCESLESAEIPQSVTSVDGVLFGSSNIKTLTFYSRELLEHMPSSSTIETINYDGERDWEFYDHFKFTQWAENEFYPQFDEFAVVDGHLIKYLGSDTEPTVPEDIEHIDRNAFEDARINGINLPSGLETIGSSAFSNTPLYEVNFPDGLKEIGEHAFSGCYNLSEIVIPQTVETIGAGAFVNCTSLRKLTVLGPAFIYGEAFSHTALEQENIDLNSGVVYESQVTGEEFVYDDALYYLVPGMPEDVMDNIPNWGTWYTTPMPTGAAPTARPEGEPEPMATPTANPTPNPSAAPTSTAEPDTTAEPADSQKIVVSTAGEDIEVFLEDEKVIFPDAQPFVDGADRTQIPIRALGEMLGFTVGWNGETLTATLSNELTRITIKIGENTLDKNGDIIEMDTAAVVIDDRTYIPLRFVGEAFGYDVEWAE